MADTYKEQIIIASQIPGREFPFPIDMLRYDSCVPCTEADSYKIEHTLEHEKPGKIMLRRFYPKMGRAEPTFGRWESFGWKVEVV